MSYCQQETKLLRSAGRPLAEELLPKPFVLWYSAHDTGCQMTIVARNEASNKTLAVWRGSVWYSSVYEFNDRDHHPGIQPGFEFAAPTIEKYFSDLRTAVADRDAEFAAQQAKRELESVTDEQALINSVRRQLGAA